MTDDILEASLFEAKRVLVGQDAMIERLFVCWLARGHCLLEVWCRKKGLGQAESSTMSSSESLRPAMPAKPSLPV